MSKEVLKTLESVREFMHAVNEFEEPKHNKDYFVDHFCMPICRGRGSTMDDYRKVTHSDNCAGCYFMSISSATVNSKMDDVINELQLLDILEVTDEG